MTIRENMEMKLRDRYVPSSQAVICMDYVIEQLKQHKHFSEEYDEGVWEMPLLTYPYKHVDFIFRRYVMDEVIKWLADLHFHQG